MYICVLSIYVELIAEFEMFWDVVDAELYSVNDRWSTNRALELTKIQGCAGRDIVKLYPS